MHIKLLSYILPFTLTLFANCFGTQEPVRTNKQPSVTVQNRPIIVVASVNKDSSKIGKALTEYLAKNNCRLPDAGDFNFSEQTLVKLKNHWGEYRVQAAAFDNFDNERPLNDFAVMLINREDAKPACFRLVFFLEKEKEYQSMIFADHVDLSSGTMYKWKEGWYLAKYDQDGNQENCFFAWDSEAQKVSCRLMK